MNLRTSMPPERPPRTPAPVTGWGGLQRRFRLLVPAPARRLDLHVFRAVARRPLPAAIDVALPTLSRAANHSRLWMAIAAGLAATAGRRGRRAALRGMVAIAATSSLTNLPAKLLTGRARPDLRVVPEARRLARVPTSTSFPSGHAASAFAFSTAAGAELPWLRLPLHALAGAVALSRVHTGVHYPGDVLAGAAFGAAVAHRTLRVWPAEERQPVRAAPAELAAAIGSDGDGIVVVANAGAGSPHTSELLQQLCDELPGLRTASLQPDESMETALRRVADDAEVLGVAGGDGTASTAAHIAYERGLPLLVVAAGTFNYLARDLGMEDVDAVVHAVRQRRVVMMDVGMIDGRVFLNDLGVGFHPQYVARREQLEVRMGKRAAVAAAMAATLLRLRPVDIAVDGRHRRVWALTVTNGRNLSPGLAPAHRQRLDEGRLEVRLVSAEPRLSRTRLLFALLLGRGQRARGYERWLTRRVALDPVGDEVRFSRDGELIDAPSDAEVAVLPGALPVFQPEP